MAGTERDPFWGKVIHSYSRAQAIDDGFLLDAGPQAREAGLSIPTVLTRSVWNRCVEVPESQKGIQDESGRLWDVLYMASVAMRAAVRAGRVGDRLAYDVLVRDGDGRRRTVSIIAHVGPGDAGEPVLTLMFPEDD